MTPTPDPAEPKIVSGHEMAERFRATIRDLEALVRTLQAEIEAASQRIEALCRSHEHQWLRAEALQAERDTLRAALEKMRKATDSWLHTALFEEPLHFPAAILKTGTIPAVTIPATTREELIAQIVEAAQLFHEWNALAPHAEPKG